MIPTGVEKPVKKRKSVASFEVFKWVVKKDDIAVRFSPRDYLTMKRCLNDAKLQLLGKDEIIDFETFNQDCLDFAQLVEKIYAYIFSREYGNRVTMHCRCCSQQDSLNQMDAQIDDLYHASYCVHSDKFELDLKHAGGAHLRISHGRLREACLLMAPFFRVDQEQVALPAIKTYLDEKMISTETIPDISRALHQHFEVEFAEIDMI